MAGANAHYVICVLAHNEERAIADTIRSITSQKLDSGAVLELFIVTNGCTDRTEEIVRGISEEDGRVHLVALPRKGKVYALRQSIAHFIRLHQQRPDFDRVFYVDADVTFLEPTTLRNLSCTLDYSPDLYLVSSYPLADATHLRSSWFLRWLSRVRQELQSNLQPNLVRGACYVIRYNALRRVSYPKDLLSDDMFLEVRLDGHFMMDYRNPTATKYKSSLRAEIQRDLFTLIAREQISTKCNCQQFTSLDPESAHSEWRFRFGKPREFAWYLLRNGKFLSLAVVAAWAPIYKFNEWRARQIFQDNQHSQPTLLDYWSTQR